MEKFYHITEVAKKLGVSAAAIRLYEKKGLISVKKDPRNGYRIFTEEDIYKIWSIFFHRSLSMKIDSINELKHAESLKAICEVVEAQKELTQQALAREKQLLAMWDMYDRYIARAKSADKAVKIVDSEPLHFFEIDDFYYRKNFGFLAATFGSICTEEDKRDYCIFCECDFPLISAEDRKRELFYAPSFQAISVTVTIAQSFDAKEALRVATEKVIKAGYEPAFPCYIFYLLSSGDFDHAVRYYEVLFPMGKKA